MTTGTNLKILNSRIVFHVVEDNTKELHFFGQLFQQDVCHLWSSAQTILGVTVPKS